LTSPHGREGLTAIGGLVVGKNALLDDVDALANLVAVDDVLWFHECPQIASIESLARRARVGSLPVSEPPRRRTLAGLERLSEVREALEVQDNATLVSLSSLAGVTS